MDKESQILDCQTPKLGYLTWHNDADRRIANGEKTIFCHQCKRYQWKDNLCKIAIVKGKR